MLKRTVTGILVTVAIYAFVFFSDVPYLPEAVAALLGGFAAYELLGASRLKSNKPLMIVASAAGAALAAVPIPYFTYAVVFTFFAALVFYSVLMARLKNVNNGVYTAVIAAIFEVVMIKAIPLLAEREQGAFALFAAFSVCFVTDTGAFFVGKAMGKHKLIPSVSPNKTREGAVGGMLLTAVLLWGAFFVLQLIGVCKIDHLLLIVYTLLASCIAQFGDLAMSSVKRVYGIKDFGKVFPGHGGVLDRFDSHVFSIAFTLIFFTLTGGFVLA